MNFENWAYLQHKVSFLGLFKNPQKFYCLVYRIVGNFVGGEVWRINSFQVAIWQKKDWQINRSADRLLLIWMVLVWQIMDNSQNSPNFPAIRYSYIEVLYI